MYCITVLFYLLQYCMYCITVCTALLQVLYYCMHCMHCITVCTVLLYHFITVSTVFLYKCITVFLYVIYYSEPIPKCVLASDEVILIDQYVKSWNSKPTPQSIVRQTNRGVAIGLPHTWVGSVHFETGWGEGIVVGGWEIEDISLLNRCDSDLVNHPILLLQTSEQAWLSPLGLSFKLFV